MNMTLFKASAEKLKEKLQAVSRGRLGIQIYREFRSITLLLSSSLLYSSRRPRTRTWILFSLGTSALGVIAMLQSGQDVCLEAKRDSEGFAVGDMSKASRPVHCT